MCSEITECGQLRLQSKAGRRFGGAAAAVADGPVEIKELKIDRHSEFKEVQRLQYSSFFMRGCLKIADHRSTYQTYNCKNNPYQHAIQLLL